MPLISAFAICLISYGAWLCRGLYPSVDWLTAGVWSLAYCVVVCLGAVLYLIWLSWRASGDRLAQSFAVFAMAGILLVFPLAIAKSQENQFTRTLDAAIAKDAAAVRTAFRQREQSRLEDEQKEMPRDRFSVYEGRVNAASLSRVRQLDREMKEVLDVAANRYKAALEDNPTRGPGDWVRIRNREELEREYAAHTRLYSETRAFTLVVERFEEEYQSRIRDLGLEPPADRIALAELQRILLLWEGDQTFTLRRLDEAVLGAAIRTLNVLRENWGAWQYNPREQQVVFEDPLNEAAFAEALSEFAEANQALEELRADPAGAATPNK